MACAWPAEVRIKRVPDVESYINEGQAAQLYEQQRVGVLSLDEWRSKLLGLRADPIQTPLADPASASMHGRNMNCLCFCYCSKHQDVDHEDALGLTQAIGQVVRPALAPTV